MCNEGGNGSEVTKSTALYIWVKSQRKGVWALPYLNLSAKYTQM